MYLGKFKQHAKFSHVKVRSHKALALALAANANTKMGTIPVHFAVVRLGENDPVNLQ